MHQFAKNQEDASWSTRLERMPPWQSLAGLVLLSMIGRGLISLFYPAPWIFFDEFHYAELARSFADSQEFRIRGVPIHRDVIAYPVLISPVFALIEDLPTAYSVARWLQSFFMSLAVVPAFLLARVLLPVRSALFAALLSVLIPSMVYTSAFMTENVSYPLFLFAAAALVRALAHPTLLRQGTVLLAIGLAYLARHQALGFLPALVLAILFFSILNARSRAESSFTKSLLAWSPTWLVFALAAVAALVHYGSLDATLHGLLGRYAYAVKSSTLDQYDFAGIAQWVLWHTAELDLYVGILPLAALFSLFSRSLNSQTSSPELRAFSSGALAVGLTFILIVSAFVQSLEIETLKERNLFFIVPFCLIAVVAWTCGVGTRVQRGEVISALIAGLLPLTLSIDKSFGGAASADTLALSLWEQLSWIVGYDPIPLAVAGFSFSGAALFIFGGAARGRRTIRLTVVFLLISQLSVLAATLRQSRRSYSSATGGTPTWIDDHTRQGDSVTVLRSGKHSPKRIYLAEFFNRRIEKVYKLGASSSHEPAHFAQVDPTTGLVLFEGERLSANHVLTHVSIGVEGELIFENQESGMRLMKVDGEVRVSHRLTGVWDDKWTGPEVLYDRPACEDGFVSFTLRRHPQFKRAQVLRAFRGAEEVGRLEVLPGEEDFRFRVPLDPDGGSCSLKLTVDPTFVPSQLFDAGDSRALGLQLLKVEFEER